MRHRVWQATCRQRGETVFGLGQLRVSDKNFRSGLLDLSHPRERVREKVSSDDHQETLEWWGFLPRRERLEDADR